MPEWKNGEEPLWCADKREIKIFTVQSLECDYIRKTVIEILDELK